jgi:hypothetical protein
MKLSDNATRTFLELETALHKRQIRSSTEALSDLLAEDFTEFGSSGRIFDRSSIIEAVTRESGELEIGVENFTARELASGVVLVSYVSRREVMGHSVRALRSSIWKLTNDRWQMVFHQGTRVPDGSKVP